MTPSGVSDLTSLPMILTIAEIAAIYRISQSTIRKALQNGTFAPQPWKTYPYRWRREDIAADLRGPRDVGPHKPHGFAATKARRQKKAALETPRTSRTAS